MSYSELPAHVNRQPLVLVVEGHALLRQAVEHIFRGQLGLERFAYAESGDAAIRGAAELEPWLVLMDFSLPDVNGLEVARRILDRVPGTHVVLLIEPPEEAYRAAAEASGVTACIAKTALWDELPVVVSKLLE
jgi:DNA-binding NarL/FixJ family response regulator